MHEDMDSGGPPHPPRPHRRSALWPPPKLAASSPCSVRPSRPGRRVTAAAPWHSNPAAALQATGPFHAWPATRPEGPQTWPPRHQATLRCTPPLNPGLGGPPSPPRPSGGGGCVGRPNPAGNYPRLPLAVPPRGRLPRLAALRNNFPMDDIDMIALLLRVTVESTPSSIMEPCPSRHGVLWRRGSLQTP